MRAPKSPHSIMHACDPAQVAEWLRAVNATKLLPTHYAMEACSLPLMITPILFAANRGEAKQAAEFQKKTPCRVHQSAAEAAAHRAPVLSGSDPANQKGGS